jgi:hypothetical protein
MQTSSRAGLSTRVWSAWTRETAGQGKTGAAREKGALPAMTLTVFPSVVAFCWDSALSCSFSRSFSLRIFSIACRCRLMMF